ncbi:MAG: hypothetical protein SOW61_07770 [Erysipelotrichaceae bacterium]|nr:hypothetical protein [Erysipelotrichaceae bacterium]
MANTISNSYHASAKAHAIRNTSKLAAVQLHDSRGYLSFSYDNDKIKSLVGDANSIVDDVKTFINDNFEKAVDEYNQKQKRKDRRIGSAFDHFENNKKLDIAVESIFQVGDKDFWSQYRVDKFFGKSKKGKDIIIHSYDEKIIEVMNDIYKKQAKALETIYIDKKEDIINKLEKAFSKADSYLNEFENKYGKDKKDQFEKLFELKPKDRKIKIGELSLDDKKLYSDYASAKTNWITIKESRLVDRTKNEQMHIKLINLTAHYDEYSPHAHGVFVTSADGYKTGLSSRISKSIVLNKWSLEVIQERMHEIAKTEMEKYPEIFNVNLRGIREGRNYDYNKEQYIDNQIKAKIQENKELKNENDKLKNEVAKLKEEKEGLENNLNEIDNKLKEIKNDIDDIKEEVSKIDELNNTQASNWITNFLNRIQLGIKACRDATGKDPERLSVSMRDLISLENILKPFVKLREKVNALHDKLDNVIKSASKLSSSRELNSEKEKQKESER